MSCVCLVYVMCHVYALCICVCHVYVLLDLFEKKGKGKVGII